MADEDGESDLGQISLYLAKEGRPFEKVIDLETLVKRHQRTEHQFEVADAICRFIYFETSTKKTNPPWLDFINVRIPATDQKSFAAWSHSANGILAIALDGQLFIATFGRSAGSLIKREEIQTDFGIRTAMNLCGNEEIRQTRTQSHSLTPTHIDRQVARPSQSFVFGLSESEDLKSIAAHLKGNPLVTLQGRDHLTIKVIGAEKLSWDRLIEQCRDFTEAYGKEDFASLFPNYRNFKPAGDDQIKLLDQALIDTLRAKELEPVQLWIPELIADDDYSFSYSDNPKRKNRIYAFLDAGQLSYAVNLDKVTIKMLHARRIYAYSHQEDRVLSHKWWSLYNCMLFEHKLGDGHFILTGGTWRQVEGSFYRSVTDFVAKQVREEACEPLYAGISIADQTARKNREAVFNTRACVLRPQSIRFDQAKLRIGSSRQDKEFCDILDLTDDGTMRIINCKPYKGSSSISYLFAQARFYCDSFLHDQVFLSEILSHVTSSPTPAKAEYLAHIKADIREVVGSDYQVCVWLLFDNKKPQPTRASLPFMAQYELKLMQEHLRNHCKFAAVVLRFIPVECVNFERDAKPTKKQKPSAGG
ncbi:TIGR04141 family sporadically distributed protein [Ancylobacter sp. A5.8]|uniref:DUF6119 family protein n=1 Tax=Ancylobacter gelatini TaxID=2919920 RepID=UPI001F4D4937|nr:DUF6119 family protein [Ancylobacter gelatini]MCJ8142872.1 TIGR04141 family sporadically distributed protein [Ancylobacter gelatini]